MLFISYRNVICLGIYSNVIQDNSFLNVIQVFILKGKQIRYCQWKSAHSSAAISERRLFKGGDGSGQHSKASELPERLQCRHPMANAAYSRLR